MNKHLSFIQSLSAPLVEIHYYRPSYDDMEHFDSEPKVIAFIRKLFDPNRIDTKEFFWVLLLSQGSRLLGIAEISVGKLNCTTVDVREIFQLALLTNASFLILAHNHPSGQLHPSQADIFLTKRINEIGKILDISVLDHFIISSESMRAISRNDYY